MKLCEHSVHHFFHFSKQEKNFNISFFFLIFQITSKLFYIQLLVIFLNLIKNRTEFTGNWNNLIDFVVYNH
jgi:hypothetical protein